MILLINYLMYRIIHSHWKEILGTSRRINQIRLFSQYPNTVYLELLSTSFVTITGLVTLLRACLLRYLDRMPSAWQFPSYSGREPKRGSGWLSLPAGWLGGWLSISLSAYCGRSVNPKTSFTICLLRTGLWDPVI